MIVFTVFDDKFILNVNTVWRPTASIQFWLRFFTFLCVNIIHYKYQMENDWKWPNQIPFIALYITEKKTTNPLNKFIRLNTFKRLLVSLFYAWKKNPEIKCHDWNFINRFETHIWRIDRTHEVDASQIEPVAMTLSIVYGGIVDTQVCVYSNSDIGDYIISVHSEEIGLWLKRELETLVACLVNLLTYHKTFPIVRHFHVSHRRQKRHSKEKPDS